MLNWRVCGFKSFCINGTEFSKDLYVIDFNVIPSMRFYIFFCYCPKRSKRFLLALTNLLSLFFQKSIDSIFHFPLITISQKGLSQNTIVMLHLLECTHEYHKIPFFTNNCRLSDTFALPFPVTFLIPNYIMIILMFDHISILHPIDSVDLVLILCTEEQPELEAILTNCSNRPFIIRCFVCCIFPRE